MEKVNMHQAKTQLSRLVERAAAGEEIVICKAGHPVAKLVPIVPERRPRQFGRLKGEIWMADDFDAPLPDDILDLFEGSETDEFGIYKGPAKP